MLGILNPVAEYLLALGVHKPVILLDLTPVPSSRVANCKFVIFEMS